MNYTYFLPYIGIEKFDSLLEKIKTYLSNIIEIKSFHLKNKIDFYPENLNEDRLNILFVPTIFNYKNALSYDGVEFAIRWYFHYISLGKCDFKIVLLGIEDKSTFFQNCNYSNFLKCPNVDYIQNNLEDIKLYLDNNNYIKKINRSEALEKIEFIGIKPPTSYKSHHSITNEWSILRWAKALKIDIEKNLKDVENNIQSTLYYNYLNTKYPVIENIKFSNKVLVNSGTILFIDDQIEKGWDVILNTICKNKTYNSFGKDFKKWTPEQIISKSLEQAKNADVIILDLRLHDDDFDMKESKDITGYKILKQIKEYNKAIQVIVFSATNKIWNLQELQEIENDGFIIKESPELSIDRDFTYNSISSIYKLIDRSLKYSYLKIFYESFKTLKKELELRKNKSSTNPLPKEFVNEYLKWLEFGILNILKYKSEEGNLLSFLIFFNVLEAISNRLIDVDNPEYISDKNYKFKFRSNYTYLKSYPLNNKQDTVLISDRNIPWKQKILNTLHELESNTTEIDELIKKRNAIIHSNTTTQAKITVDEKELKLLFKIITNNIGNIA